MKTATKAQLQYFHGLLRKVGLMDEKKALVLEASKGRTESSKELTVKEMSDLIKVVAQAHDPAAIKAQEQARSADRMRKKIIGLCRDMGMEKVNGSGKTVADMPRIKAFILEKGYLKKPLNDYTNTELQTLVGQVGKIREGVATSNRNKMKVVK